MTNSSNIKFYAFIPENINFQSKKPNFIQMTESEAKRYFKYFISNGFSIFQIINIIFHPTHSIYSFLKKKNQLKIKFKCFKATLIIRYINT